MKHSLGIAMVVAGLLLSSTSWGAMYRWVDEEGNVHYSDKLPPEAIQRDREVLDEQGRRVEVQPAPKTAAQKAEEERQRQEVLAEQRLKAEEERKDRVLLQMFTTVEEIEIARDDRLAQIEAQIALAESKLERLRSEHTTLKQRIENIDGQGKPVPPQLQENFEVTKQSLMDNERFLQERKAEHQQLEEKFAADIERFKELKAEKAAEDAAR